MTDREPVDVTKEQLTVLCVKPGEKPKRIEIESSLDALQRAVGGYIEAVRRYQICYTLQKTTHYRFYVVNHITSEMKKEN